MKNYIEQRTVDLQTAIFASRVVDETQFPEPVHEKAYPRTSGADHLRQGFLTDLGNHGLRNTFLAKMSQHEENARQTLFPG